MSIDYSAMLSKSSDAELAELIAKLEQVQEIRLRTAELTRDEFRTKYPTPGALAKAYQRGTRQTPALDAIDRALVRLADSGNAAGREMIFVPPQEGKSTRASCWFPLWMLAQDPGLRIAIVVYSAEKAERWGRWIRRMIEAHPDLGIELAQDSRAVNRFETTAGGVVLSVGIDGGLTSEPVDVLIIDDPLKGRAEAESPTYRNRCWDWWESNAMTRASDQFKVVLMMCMTGDTPVLRPDGTETPLRDIRPGDKVATYEDGRLTTSTVMNWANQGPDDLFRIKMKSGRVVRANARHPFLTIDADGKESWLRTDQIRPGTRIQTATGASGAGSPVPAMGATNQPDAKGCATLATARPAGLPVFARHRSMLRRGEGLASSTATASLMRKWTSSSTGRTGTAPSAGSPRPTPIPEPTGTASCASTTTTTRAGCEDCSATTATSPLDTGSHPRSFEPLLTTWNVTPDEVVTVEPCGCEDVFDLQIAHTENFIANGLVSHNTRWHSDDLAGRLMKEEPGEWNVLRIPAVRDAESADVRGSDGASVFHPNGELISVRNRPLGWFLALKAKRSLYVWNSIYKQTPVAAEGNLFARSDFRYWQFCPPDKSHVDPLHGARLSIDGVALFIADMVRFITVDLAASKKTSADWTVASVWAIVADGRLVLLDRRRSRLGETEHWSLVRPLCVQWACPDVYVEKSFITATFVRDATRGGIRVQPVTPETDKITRSIPAANRVRSHTVFWPDYVEWLDEWCDEIAGFPEWRWDDQADTLFYAGRIASAHWTPPPKRPPRPARPRDLAYEAATGLSSAVDLDRAEW